MKSIDYSPPDVEKGRLVFSRLVALYAVLLVAFLSPLGYSIYLNNASYSWVATPAELKTIGPFRNKSISITYEYTFQSQRFQCSRLAFLSAGSIDDALLIEESYKVGDWLIVYVNPSRPSQAVVLRRRPSFKYTWKNVFVAAGFSAIAAMWLYRAVQFLGVLWRAVSPTPTDSISPTKPN